MINNQLSLQQQAYLNQEQEQQKYFCYMHIKQMQVALIGFLELIFWTALLLFVIRQYRTASKLSLVNRNVRIIYITIFMQCFLFLVKMAFSEAVYWMEFQVEDSHDKAVYLSNMSKAFFIIDVFGVFLVQAMLILVCYNWMDKVADILQQILNIEDDQPQDHTKKLLKFQRVCRTILGYFLVFRFFLYGFITGFIIYESGRPEGNLFQIILIIMIVQAILVPFILGVGVFGIRHNRKIKQIATEQEIATMVNQYIVMILIEVARLFFGFYVTIQQFRGALNQKCVVHSWGSTHQLAINIPFHICQDIICYILPVLIVLRVFRVSNKNPSISQSLIGLDHRSSSSGSINLTK